MVNLLRTLTWFDKQTDEWVGEVRLRGVKLPQLQKLFGVSSDDPMYECFKVKKKHVEAVEKWACVPIFLSKFDYFVECTSAGVPQASLAARG